MKQMKNDWLLMVLMIAIAGNVTAQLFINEITDFKKKDSLNPPLQNAILFVGSSSFRKWTEAGQVFNGYLVINRGFGGSSLPDVIRYADDIIFPYQSRQILVYCGDNDLAASDTITAATVVQRFRQLFYLIRNRMKAISVAFVSIKPCPARKHLMLKRVVANTLIKQFLCKQKKARCIDVYHPMLLPDGYPNSLLFVSHSLHITTKGYAIWKKKIELV